MSTVEEWSHLTWSGRLDWIYYAIRRHVISPAADGERCIMGYPIGEHVRCPRRAEDLWCKRHRA